MAYTYADWITITDLGDRLTRLNLHIAEVTLQMGPDVASDASSISRSGLGGYLSSLYTQQAKLEARAGRAASGGVSYGTFGGR